MRINPQTKCWFVLKKLSGFKLKALLHDALFKSTCLEVLIWSMLCKVSSHWNKDSDFCNDIYNAFTLLVNIFLNMICEVNCMKILMQLQKCLKQFIIWLLQRLSFCNPLPWRRHEEQFISCYFSKSCWFTHWCCWPWSQRELVGWSHQHLSTRLTENHQVSDSISFLI